MVYGSIERKEEPLIKDENRSSKKRKVMFLLAVFGVFAIAAVISKNQVEVEVPAHAAKKPAGCKCGTNSNCIKQGKGWRCECKKGFRQNMYKGTKRCIPEQQCQPATTPSGCVDMVIVFDVSGSIDANEFNLARKSTANFVERLGPGFRVGLVKFGNNGANVFYMNTHPNGFKASNAIRDFPRFKGKQWQWTRPERGIALALKDQYLPNRGGRKNCQKVMLIVTDGSFCLKSCNKDCCGSPDAVANFVKKETGCCCKKGCPDFLKSHADLKAANVQAYAVGIGKFSAKQMSAVTTGDYSNPERFIRSNGGFRLGGAMTEFFGNFCPGVFGPSPPEVAKPAPMAPPEISQPPVTTTTAAAPPKVPECIPKDQPVDLVYVVDQSGSIRSMHFEKVRASLSSSIDGLDVTGGTAQVGLVKFNHEATPVFSLNKYKTNEAVKNAIETMSYDKGRTRIDLGVELALDKYFTTAGGDRTGTKNYMIVVTDGENTSGADFAALNARAQAKGIELLAIPVGDQVSMEELSLLTTGKDDDTSRIFSAESFDFSKILKDLQC